MKNVSPWTTHETRMMYDNPWIRVAEHRVTQPAGSPGIYGVVHMKNVATGVVALDGEGHTWLVGQWRYPLAAWSWEIPEGGGDPDRPPEEAARRELREETGLEAGEWTPLLTMHLSNSVTDEEAHVFLARDLRRAAEPELEPTEDIVVRRLPFAEALEMVERGEITDAVSVAGLLRAERVLRNGPPGT